MSIICPDRTLARAVLKCEEKEDSMTFIIGSVLGLAFLGGWILSEVCHLQRLENERREQEIKARVDARVAAVQSPRTPKRVRQAA
jgi:hypothetical protein